jgi:hypothetical protein
MSSTIANETMSNGIVNDKLPLTTNTTTQKDPCDLQCARNYDPVCGSDGIVYGNFCYFEAAQCVNNSIRFMHYGEC